MFPPLYQPFVDFIALIFAAIALAYVATIAGVFFAGLVDWFRFR